jgi:branched-chain amino acid transport system ATP-binding protein
MLSIENLEVTYGVIKALQGLSMKIEQGEIVALIGANGAGKSTLLRAISGMLRPSAGTIRFRDTPLEDVPAHEIVRRGISHVPEGRAIFSNLTVRENLRIGAYLRQDGEAVETDLKRIFDLFPRLKERLQQSAATLSGGEQQMLAISRAMMARPSLLLLDEPSLGLAPIVVQSIFKTIQKINAEGTTILLVEQNAHMALQVANRGYVLQTGQIVITGNGKDLLETDKVKQFYLGEA